MPSTLSSEQYGAGYGLDLVDVARIIDWYAGDQDLGDPRLSPALSPDLSGLPPTLVTVAELDPVRDQGEAYAARLDAAGVAVTLVRTPGHVHGSTWLTGLTASAAEWHDHCACVLTSFHADQVAEVSA
jgi:acetyl esterase